MVYINKNEDLLKCKICKQDCLRTSPFQLFCISCRVTERKKYKNEYEKDRMKNPVIFQKYAKWRKTWVEKNKERLNSENITRRNKLKTKIYEYYGNKCACCGETEFKFLSIDHINGRKDKTKSYNKKIATGEYLYREIIKNDYPNDIQILCFNCNCSKGFFGECPHKKTKTLELL